MSISFIAQTDFQETPVAPAPETFALVLADQSAFPRFFPYSMTDFKTGLVGDFAAFDLGDHEVIKGAMQALIQAGLVGGGATVSAATARARTIIAQDCAIPLAIAILTDAGA
jgi:hypothetical protein